MLVSVSNPYSVRNRAPHSSSRGPCSQQTVGNLAFKAGSMQHAGILIQPILCGVPWVHAILEGPVTAECWKWPLRHVASTKCVVRSLNFRCGLFHPPPSCKRTASSDKYPGTITLPFYSSILQTAARCAIHRHSPLQVRCDPLQIWEEPLRKFRPRYNRHWASLSLSGRGFIRPL